EFTEPPRNKESCSVEFSSLERGPMSLSVRHKLSRLPKRFPVGTTFVVEGGVVAANGKNNGHFRVFSRFVVLPGGRRIDLGGDATGGPVDGGPGSGNRKSEATRASPGEKK